MKSSITGILVVILIVIIGAAWWFIHGGSQAPVTTQAPVGIQYIPDNLLLGTDATTTLGTYLIGSDAMTLYTYAPDKPGVSNCTGDCAATWPPYLLTDPSVLGNVQAGIPGPASTTLRADGGMQVTYEGHPLYFYIGDAKDGDVNGEGIGGVWHVVRIDGSAIGPKTVGAGAHCGGNIQDAPICSAGLHCQLVVSRPDTGGTCVKD